MASARDDGYQVKPEAGKGTLGGMNRRNLTIPLQRSQHGIADGSTDSLFGGRDERNASSSATASFTGMEVEGCMNP